METLKLALSPTRKLKYSEILSLSEICIFTVRRRKYRPSVSGRVGAKKDQPELSSLHLDIAVQGYQPPQCGRAPDLESRGVASMGAVNKCLARGNKSTHRDIFHREATSNGYVLDPNAQNTIIGEIKRRWEQRGQISQCARRSKSF